jgi:protocatechuate 3,4-dioxygenase beta subunit
LHVKRNADRSERAFTELVPVVASKNIVSVQRRCDIGHDKGRDFKTIKPGAYPLSFLGGDGWRCRHIHFKVAQDGHPELITQMYFEGDPLIEQDLEIAKAPEELRHLLIAKPVTDEASGLPLYRFNIVLQPVAV